MLQVCTQQARMEQKLFYLASNAPFLLAGIGEADSMLPLKSDIRHGNRQLGLSEAGFLCLVKGSGLPASQGYGQGGIAPPLLVSWHIVQDFSACVHLLSAFPCLSPTAT